MKSRLNENSLDGINNDDIVNSLDEVNIDDFVKGDVGRGSAFDGIT